MEMYATEEGRLILVYGIQDMSDLLVNLWVKHEWEHWNSIPDVVQNELISTYELPWHVQNHGLNEPLKYTLEQNHLHWIWNCELIHPSWILKTNYVLACHCPLKTSSTKYSPRKSVVFSIPMCWQSIILVKTAISIIPNGWCKVFNLGGHISVKSFRYVGGSRNTILAQQFVLYENGSTYL